MNPSTGKPFERCIETDRVVRGDFYEAASHPARGTLIICHGYKGFKDWGMFPHVAQTLAEDVDVISINFSYNGVGADLLEFTELEKFARETYSKDLEDLHAVVNDIRNREVSATEKPILLLGHSRGAAVCMIYALDHPEHIAGVISWNGIANVDLFTEENKDEMRATGRTYTMNGRTKQNMPLDLEILEDMEHNRERFDIVGRISGAKFPIALIQGAEDGERGLRGSKRLVEQNAAITWIKIPEGNHTFGSVHPYKGETKPLKEAIRETKRTIKGMLA
ncbi:MULTISPECIES: S9 family peptidase [unclassified Paenibacillus]|uniref:alpha/beta hydrolase family protein n=1 Tax=unclassified Paenibacillus TaxID=185978 RepID=UPI00278030B2|nr:MULTISPECIES: alpha/beta fold hydrolase [unclassified Paenibacillus]MDQ0900080.1 pimeloyl-ACP methyl ester carboxylesterase [Paenibacillus sp. V4I7]MDQ0921407.1 pimeloyl-ACP methyl ester carboxylesterase [Paenibacillus sp. V4I5]